MAAKKATTAKKSPAPKAAAPVENPNKRPPTYTEHFCEQGTEEWHQLRCGVPTASMFRALMTSKGEDSKMRQTYLYQLAGERLTGVQTEGFKSEHMKRGHEMEHDAREYYCFTKNVEVKRVGFIRGAKAGCSPDSLIVGKPGALEIKTMLPHLLIPLVEKGEFPAAHKAQCQGIMWLRELEFVDLCVFWPGIKSLTVTMTRDEPYIKELSDAVDRFDLELRRLVEKMKA